MIDEHLKMFWHRNLSYKCRFFPRVSRFICFMDHYILVMGLTEPNRSVVPDNKIDCLLAYQKIPVPIAEGKHESIFVSSSNEWRPGIIGCF